MLLRLERGKKGCANYESVSFVEKEKEKKVLKKWLDRGKEKMVILYQKPILYVQLPENIEQWPNFDFQADATKRERIS